MTQPAPAPNRGDPSKPPPGLNSLQAKIWQQIYDNLIKTGASPEEASRVADQWHPRGWSGLIKDYVPGGEALVGLGDALDATRRWVSVRHNWVRVGWVAAGATLIAIGAAVLVKPATRAAARTAAQTAGRILPS